jgi:hypothetical protein
MSRSNYSEDLESWDLIRWRGAVASAIRGKRGQAFLREMLAALDALPEKRLIEDELVTPEGCCGLGAVAIKRGLDVANVDAHDPESVAAAFGITVALAAEIEDINDRGLHETPEARFAFVRGWVTRRLSGEPE